MEKTGNCCSKITRSNSGINNEKKKIMKTRHKPEVGTGHLAHSVSSNRALIVVFVSNFSCN